MTMLLKGGRVIDPSQKIDDILDVLIEGGKIAAVSRNLVDDGKGKKKDTGLTVLDLKGKIVVPGLIDMHTHLREPGYEYKETIASGSEAAVAGGFHLRRLHAQHEPRERQPVRHRIHPQAGPEGKPRQRLPDCGYQQGIRREDARRVRRSQGGGRGGLFR